MVTNWTELPADPSGNASCENLLVRGTIFATAVIGTFTPTVPLILIDTRLAAPTSVSGTIDLRGPAGTRMTLRPTAPGVESQAIRWLTEAAALVFSMGNDANATGGAAGKNWWVFDNTAAIYPLYFPSGQPGDTTGSIRWQSGRIAYDTATNRMTRRVNNVIRETLDTTTWTLDSLGTVLLSSAATMALTSGAAAAMQAAGAAAVQAGSTLALVGGSTALLQAGTDVTVQGLNNATVTSGDTTTISALVSAEGVGRVVITASEEVNIGSGAGVTVGLSGEDIAFFGVTPVGVQHIGAVSAATDIGIALIALGLCVTP